MLIRCLLAASVLALVRRFRITLHPKPLILIRKTLPTEVTARFQKRGEGTSLIVSDTHEETCVRPEILDRLRNEAASGKLVSVEVVCFRERSYHISREGVCHAVKEQNYNDDIVNTLAKAAGGMHKIVLLIEPRDRRTRTHLRGDFSETVAFLKPLSVYAPSRRNRHQSR